MAGKGKSKDNAGNEKAAAEKAAAEAEAAKKKAGVLRVKTVRGVKSFYRGGLQFTNETRDVPLADLTKKQVKAIKDEPRLEVEEIKE